MAKAAGVSAPTVSLVLNNKPGTRISEETAQRIRRAAQQLHYSPNPVAQGLRTGHTRTIGFLSDAVTITRYASPIIRGALDQAKKLGYAIVLAEVDGDQSAAGHAIEDFVARGVSGLLIACMQARRIELPHLPDGIPHIVVNAMTNQETPSILPAEYEGGYQAAHYLIEHGHRRIAVVGQHPSHRDLRVSVTIMDRFSGVAKACDEAGIQPLHVAPSVDWEPQVGYQAGEELLTNPHPVSAVIAANDRVALGIHQYALGAGLHLPDDLSIISFDDEPLASYLHPGITTMRLPYREMGETAMRLLTASTTAPPLTRIPMPLIERDSVAVWKENH